MRDWYMKPQSVVIDDQEIQVGDHIKQGDDGLPYKVGIIVAGKSLIPAIMALPVEGVEYPTDGLPTVAIDRFTDLGWKKVEAEK